MKLVKIEKPNCPACNQVSALLDNAEVPYAKWDITGDGEESDKAREALSVLGLFTVPVTILLNDDDSIKEHARGFNPNELQNLINMV